MERGSLEKLKFDKRLSQRRDWHKGDELKAHLESLPDVFDKRNVETEASETTSAPEDVPSREA